MADITLTPELLNSQAQQMEQLMNSYDALFSKVSSELNHVNSNWSTAIASNFSGKIHSAQRSFASVVAMLGTGVTAAREAVDGIVTVDTVLEKMINGEPNGLGLIGNINTAFRHSVQTLMNSASYGAEKIKNSVNDVLKPSKEAFKTFLLNRGLSVDRLEKNSDNPLLITLSGDMKDDIKKFYSDTDPNTRGGNVQEYIYTSYGNKGEVKALFSDLIYQKNTDVITAYYNVESKSGYEKTSAGYSITGQEFIISEGSDSAINIKLNTADYHGSVVYNPEGRTAFATLGTEYDVVSAGFGLGDSVNDFGSIESHVKVGVGAGFNAGINNGVIKASGSVAGGIGFDIDVEINLNNYIQAFKDAF